MNFGFVVRHGGIQFFTSLRLDRAGFTDPKIARRIAEEQVIASGITGTVEIEVGALAAGVVGVDRRVFVVPPMLHANIPPQSTNGTARR
jgi:hypothetical protein